MTDDIVARLRESDGGNFMRRMFAEAADEIERLRKELGQVSDADSWVSKADAAILDSLLNWCEFNEMDSHRALQRLVNDRARLRAEVIRLRAERDAARAEVCLLRTGPTSATEDATQSLVDYAKSRGWIDLFKEENDER